jgi:ATP-dependent DNA helicase RecG
MSSSGQTNPPKTSKGSDDQANSLQFFPGVGPTRAPLLEKLGIRKPSDLLFYFPRSYQDVAQVCTVAQLESDVRATVIGVVEAIDLRTFEDGRTMLGVLLDVSGGFVRLVWFNQPFRRHQIAHGMRMSATGTPKPTGISWEMRHPEVQILGKDQEIQAGKPLPVYALTEGIQQRHLQKIIATAIERLSPELEEALSDEVRQKYSLMDIASAIKQIHEPDTLENAHQARRRFIFQELLVFQLALAMRRFQAEHSRPAPKLESTAQIHARIIRRFPFELTHDQLRVIREVSDDMNRELPMNRLLQGDVGSGKTVVAVYAMLLAVAHHHQAVFMVPTEVLARQHASRMAESLQSSQVHVELLTGSMGQRERNELLERIALGTVDIVVGTTALLNERVEFNKLGIIVIDEQHRFGVQQRATLRTSRTQPHYLVLSATPIPRTLAMTAFGDLDVSIIKDKPQGRAVVHTYVGRADQMASWWSFVVKQVKQGRQAYVIAPRVAQDEEDNTASVEQSFEELGKGPLRELRMGLLHGRMDGPTKQSILDAFTNGQIDVLVATTVVEVGIDIPNATVMTILDANRLGLAQLHQLRGRISRGTHPGYLCLFTSDGTIPEENSRIAALASTDDGFALAELDLRLRGPGQLLGTQQHGLPPFRIADLSRDADIVVEAREEARRIIAEDPTLAGPKCQRLKRQVQGRHGDMISLGDVG